MCWRKRKGESENKNKIVKCVSLLFFSYSCIMFYPNLLQSLPSFVSAKIRAEGRSIINNFRKKYISLGEKNELVC